MNATNILYFDWLQLNFIQLNYSNFTFKHMCSFKNTCASVCVSACQVKVLIQDRVNESNS